MTDLECFQIQTKAILHLLKCGFDDWAIEITNLSNTFTTNLKKELEE